MFGQNQTLKTASAFGGSGQSSRDSWPNAGSSCSAAVRFSPAPRHDQNPLLLPTPGAAKPAGWRRECIRAASLALCITLAGCAGLAPKPLAGGKARIPVGADARQRVPTIEAGGKVAPSAAVQSQDIEQPENPAQPASQTRSESERVELPLPAGSKVTTSNAQLSTSNSQPAPGVSVELSAPSTLKIERTTESGQHIGAAQKDTSREVAAKLASFKSVQWLGFILILASLAMFHPIVKAVTQSSTLQMVTGAVGVFLIFAPAVVVGNEQLFLVLGLGLPALWFFVHKHGRLQGLVDANKDGVDDRLQNPFQRGARSAERGTPPLNSQLPNSQPQ